MTDPDIAAGSTQAERVVRGMWAALSARDWDGVAGFIADDGIYVDMPIGPVAAARGPVDVVKRLRLGLAGLAAYENHDGVLVSDGTNVLYEHSERWQFTTGEIVDLAFATVHRVVDGKITLWKDYWDFAAVANAAPPDWLASLESGDMSWMYDATGEI